MDFPILLASDPFTAVAYMVVTAVTLAASYFLSQQMRRQQRGADLLPDYESPNVATQGAVIPWLYGPQRMGAVIAYVQSPPTTVWVPQRSTRRRRGKAAVFVGVQSAVNGGLYGERTRQENFIAQFAAAGWHLICIGPASRLTRIWENGKVIWTGDITPDNTPSGSSVQTDTRGEFIVCWGEDDQPVVPEIEAALGRASNFPRVFSIFWKSFLTGNSTRWPQLEYEVTVSDAGSTDPCSTDTVTVTGDDGDALSAPEDPFVDSTTGTGTEVLTYDLTYSVVTEGWYYLSGRTIDLQDNLVVSGTLDYYGQSILIELSNGVETITILDDVVPDLGDPVSNPTIDCWSAGYGGGDIHVTRDTARQFVYLTAGTWTMTLTVSAALSGAGAGKAHVEFGPQLIELENPVVTTNGGNFLRRILFEPFPYGLNLSTDDIDETSVNTVMEELADEGVTPLRILAKNGEEVAAVIGSFLKDAGVLMSWNPTTGKYEFIRVRQEAQAYSVPEQGVETRLPEIEVYHGDRRPTALQYAFPDSDRAYRDTVIGIDEDGNAKRLETIQARKQNIDITVDFDAAVVIAERRSQEELGNPAAFTLELLRGAATLRVGSLIRLPSSLGIAPALRVLEVQGFQKDNRTKVKAVCDYYGVETSGFAHEGDGGGTPPATHDPLEDLAVAIFEVPEDIAAVLGVTIAVVRVRANANILTAELHLSPDDVNYAVRGDTQFQQAGGELTQGIAADDPWIIEEGPEFTTLGPDIGQTEDLSADEIQWQRGRQVAVINNELFFVREVAPVSGSTYQLKGLIRARFDTERAAHAIGDTVYIFPLGNVADINDPGFIVPGATVYLKAQPWTSRPFNLADITAVSKTLEGKGLVPVKPSSLRVTAPTKGSASYRTGQNIEIAWGYHNAVGPTGVRNQGAGLVPVGTGYVTPPPRGTFKIEFLDSMNVSIDEIDVGVTPSYTIDNGDLVTMFGGEPASFKVRVRNVYGTFRSNYAELTITRL